MAILKTKIDPKSENIEKMRPRNSRIATKNSSVAPQERLWIRSCFYITFWVVLAPILEVLGSIFVGFWKIFRAFLVYSRICFRLLRSSANSLRKSERLPRTKPRTKPRTHPDRRLQEPSDLRASFSLTLFLTANLRTPKTLGGGTPPGGLQ